MEIKASNFVFGVFVGAIFEFLNALEPYGVRGPLGDPKVNSKGSQKLPLGHEPRVFEIETSNFIAKVLFGQLLDASGPLSLKWSGDP